MKRVPLRNAFLTSSGHMDAFASVPFFGSMALILSRVLAFSALLLLSRRAALCVRVEPHIGRLNYPMIGGAFASSIPLVAIRLNVSINTCVSR